MAEVIKINRPFTQEELGNQTEVIKINRPFTTDEIKTSIQIKNNIIDTGTESERSNLLNKPVETLLRSGGQYAGNIFSAIGHPIRTLGALGGTAVGAAQKLIPGKQPQERYIEGLVDFYKQRYGGLENIKKTVLEDPVGFAGDISTLLTGGGAAISKVGQMSKLGKIAKTGQLASRAGTAIEPLSAATRGAGRVVKNITQGKRIAPFASKLDKPVIEAAKEIKFPSKTQLVKGLGRPQVEGLDLPASAVSTSKAIPALETLAGKGFFGEGIIQKVNKAQAELSKYADDIIAQTGKAEDMSSAGQAIFKGADKYRNSFIQIKNDLYNKALLPGREEVIKVIPQKSLSFIEDVLKNKQEAAKLLGSSQDIAYFRNLAEKLTKGTQEEIGILNKQGKMITKNIPIHGKEIQSAIRELNQKLNTSFADSFVAGNQGTLKKLVTLLSEDLDRAIIGQRQDLAQAIEKANQFYSEGISKLNSVYGDKIFKLARAEQHDKILPAIINRGTSIEDIPKIYEIIGKENIPALQSAFLEDFFKGSKNSEGNFTPLGINKQINKYGGEIKLKAILNPQQLKAVKNLETITRSLGKAERVASGSQTAFIGRLATEASTLFVNPALSLKLILGDALLSKFISSPMGQKILTTGIILTGKTGRKIEEISPKLRTPSQILRIGNITEEEQK